MSNQFHPVFEKKFLVPIAILCAGVCLMMVSTKPSELKTHAARLAEKRSSKGLSKGVRDRQQQQNPITKPNEKPDVQGTNLDTKFADRGKDSDTSVEASREKFWLGAKLPDGLLAASLPVLEAAVPPDSQALDREIDHSAEVSIAFGKEDTFDYKRANEILFLWLVTEPEAASAWLSEQADFSRYDMAFGLVADAMGQAGRADIGEQWTDLIPSPTKREDARVDMYAGVYSRGQDVPIEMLEQVITSDRID